MSLAKSPNSAYKAQHQSALAPCDAFDLTLDWIYSGDMRGLRHETAMAIKALKDEACGASVGGMRLIPKTQYLRKTLRAA